MPQFPAHDPLEPCPVAPERGHLYVLALAAVTPMTTALVVRLTVYSPAHCYKLLCDLRRWGWLRQVGDELAITSLGRRSLSEMVTGARQELGGRSPSGNP
jgi:DNA-binding IclR family transcriptional regulator